MSYHLYVEDGELAATLPGYLHEAYGVDRTQVDVGGEQSPAAPVAMLVPPAGDGLAFGGELTGMPALVEATGGLSELDFTSRLCRALSVRALVDPGTPFPDRWVLVTRDGSHGWVHTSEDGRLVIEYALEPIAGEPGLEVKPPPDWAT